MKFLLLEFCPTIQCRPDTKSKYRKVPRTAEILQSFAEDLRPQLKQAPPIPKPYLARRNASLKSAIRTLESLAQERAVAHPESIQVIYNAQYFKFSPLITSLQA